MAQSAHFLHITDTHLKPKGATFKFDDRKVNPMLEPQNRESAVKQTLQRLAEGLKASGRSLDAVIFTGDALAAGVQGGDQLLLEMLLEHLAPFGITADKIVAVPGNHDIPRDTDPSSSERYENFINVWRKAGCITPWLDGIDDEEPDWRKHILVEPQAAWAIIACNSCNWSHANAIPEDLRSVWGDIPTKLAGGIKGDEEKYRNSLGSIARYDMARLSPDQMNHIRLMLQDDSFPKEGNDRQVRLLALHHHLRSPSLHEEVKPFSDFSNLEQVRTLVAELGIQVLLHGHKHQGRLFFDIIDHPTEEKPPHRALVISGASFDEGNNADALRTVEIKGMPWAPALTTQAYAVPRGGLKQQLLKSSEQRLWTNTDGVSQGAPMVEGKNFDEVYAKVKVLAEHEAKNGPLIVHLDLTSHDAIRRLPEGYPDSPATIEERQRWLSQLVEWWQQPKSQLQERIPYIHGPRLRRYANYIDQIERVKRLLKAAKTTRAIATLLDPAADFQDGEKSVDFASFCLVQFIKRELSNGSFVVDCVAYYRVQEMVRWWPINVAELHHIQTQVAASCSCPPGRITTITASARWNSRAPALVAMPSIDRWLDQSPEKYFVLANALLGGPVDPAAAKPVVDEWLAALELLKRAATEADPAGNPVVAIEGPKCLARYLKSGVGSSAKNALMLADTLNEVSRVGAAQTFKDDDARTAWGRQLSQLLGNAIAQTKELTKDNP